MEAKELMLGDWVSYIPEIEVGEDSYLGEPRNVQVDLPCFERIDELIFAPIPLTPEILEKNEFVRGKLIPSKFYRNIYKEQIMFCPYSFGYDIKYISWNELNDVDVAHCLDVQQPMKYVHEMQHALRLFGLNELADGFKV